jgi:hypothetical protein
MSTSPAACVLVLLGLGVIIRNKEREIIRNKERVSIRNKERGSRIGEGVVNRSGE